MANNLMQDATKTSGSYYLGYANPNLRESEYYGLEANARRKTNHNSAQEKTFQRTNSRESSTKASSASSSNRAKASENIYSKALRDPFAQKARLERDNPENRNLGRLKSPVDRRDSQGFLENSKPVQSANKVLQSPQQQVSGKRSDTKQTSRPSQSIYNGLNSQNVRISEDKPSSLTAAKLENLLAEEPRPYIIKQNTPPNQYRASMRTEINQFTPEQKQLPTESIRATHYSHPSAYQNDKTAKYPSYSSDKIPSYLATGPNPTNSGNSNVDLEQDTSKRTDEFSVLDNSRLQNVQKLSQNYLNSQTIIKNYSKMIDRSTAQEASVNQTPTNHKHTHNLDFKQEEYGHDEGTLSFSKHVDSGTVSASHSNEISSLHPENNANFAQGLVLYHASRNKDTIKDAEKSQSNLQMAKKPVYTNTPGNSAYSTKTSKNSQEFASSDLKANTNSKGHYEFYSKETSNNTTAKIFMNHQYPIKNRETREDKLSDCNPREISNYSKYQFIAASYEQKNPQANINSAQHTKLSPHHQNETSMNISVSDFLAHNGSNAPSQANTLDRQKFACGVSNNEHSFGSNQQILEVSHQKDLIPKDVTPREQLFHTHNQIPAEVQNIAEDVDSNWNYSNISTPIRAITLHSEQDKTHYFQNPFTQNPSATWKQKVSTQVTALDDEKQNEKPSDGNQRESIRTNNVNALFEEYRNSADRARRSRSQGVRRETLNKERKSNIFLSHLKDIPGSIVKSTKNYFVNKLSLSDARVKCSCSSDLSRNETCDQAMEWLLTRYKLSELEYLKKTYENLLVDAEIDSKSQKQIMLDISRTCPESKYFKPEGGGLVELKRVLECFAKYDPQIGYVQGMNFIAASFLYHAEEYIAFWLLAMMFELFEMRDIYQKNLPGLTKHSQIIDFLILNQIPKLYEHLSNNEIRVEMFCTEWVCGLFGNIIPIEEMAAFLSVYIQRGWSFFYRAVLSLLLAYQDEILAADDMSSILLIFKRGINMNISFSPRSKRKRKINWEQIFRIANSIEIDDFFISSLHTRFDPEHDTFNMQTNN